MADVTRKECDVFHTTKDVRRYKFEVAAIKHVADDVVVKTIELDLSARGLKRALHFVEVGTRPPRKKIDNNGDS